MTMLAGFQLGSTTLRPGPDNRCCGISLATCRCCGAALTESFADLGMMPLATACADPGQAPRAEPFYPLHALVCSDCRLVQLPDPGIPEEAPSGRPWPATAPEARLVKADAQAARLAARFELGPQTPVLDVAGGGGDLLQCLSQRGIPVLAVEPIEDMARSASARGIPTAIARFGAATARRLRATGAAPALMLANGALARVPDLHDFVEGFRILLAPGGVAVFEFPHLLRLIESNAFDSIRREQVSCLSLLVAELILGQHGLVVFDLEEIPDESSLRLFAGHVEDRSKAVSWAVQRLRLRERAAGLEGPDAYRRFAEGVVQAKCALLDFLIGARRAGQRVAGYGASARANTLLSYCGVGPELLPFTVDPCLGRQGMLLPGTRIMVRAPEAILEERPDFLLILPWYQREAVVARMSAIRGWVGRFTVPLPILQVF
jgi:hypothetical protein